MWRGSWTDCSSSLYEVKVPARQPRALHNSGNAISSSSSGVVQKADVGISSTGDLISVTSAWEGGYFSGV